MPAGGLTHANTCKTKWTVLVLSSCDEERDEIAAILGTNYAVHHATLFDGFESAIQSVGPDLVILDWTENDGVGTGKR